VRVARFDGTSWSHETVDNGGPGIDHGHYPNGDAAVSHGWGSLRLGRRSGAGWSVETVASSSNNDETSLAFDANGYPAIAHTARAKGKFTLHLSRWTGSQWQTEQVDPVPSGRWKSLAFDPAGNPAVAYSNDENDDGWLESLKLARFEGSKWNIEVVEGGPVGYGVSASLAFDGSGRPAIAHKGAGTVRFLRWTGSSWSVETVGGAGSASWCRLMFDGTGNPRIAISDFDHGFQLASRSTSGWETESVDDGFPVGHFTLRPDGAGNPTISFSRWSTKQVIYARRK